MSEKKAFLKQVTDPIKSKEAKKIVALELDQHLEAAVRNMLKSGLSREEAESQAVKRMGDPVKLGIKMGKLHRPKIDWSLLSLVLLLYLVGFLPLLITHHEFQFSLFKKSLDVLLGIVIVLTLMMFDYRKLMKTYWPMLSIAGIILVLFFHLGFSSRVVNGVQFAHFGTLLANSLIVIPLLFIGWAGFLHRYANRTLFISGVFFLSLVFYIPISPVTNVVVYVVMVVVMYLWSIRNQSKKLVASIIAALFTVVTGFLLVFWQNLYMRDRLMGFLFPEQYESTYGYFYLQFKKYLSEAGWFGQFSQMEKFDMAEMYTDMVFVTLTYSFGWVFAVVMVLFLAVVMVRMCWISRKTRDSFGQLLIVGAAALYTVPFVYNIGMVLGLVPIAGFSLPFISYGAVPIVINSIMIGLVLSVYRRKNLIVSIN
ncbi:MAG TPA: FtsW/RodA/SpoVE family cell cycle protein [Bacillus bacterium]|uniref:FtsW/RodA/SpoVE family cell cycle protein n=1 Tax=Siminovitchia fordii TaxID=254759 RepID=UPI00037099D1|nr:FtsW/RodA/SpoVE family cell cycle protein [Siminovitchia fordii]HBZ11185.1 FtsW/RodA/SpoVE family cell cycle protein [Bacillus sp. (in: firmicutes)]